jgi:SHS2 domain-containing protein
MGDAPEMDVLGVTPLEHTADVGLEIEAPDLESLFVRAALGMAWLLLEHEPPLPTEARPLVASGADPAGLLRDWLRELLFWHETEGFTPSSFRFRVLTRTRLEAAVEGGLDDRIPVRELKGVTLHGLAVGPHGRGWKAQVIFDV